MFWNISHISNTQIQYELYHITNSSKTENISAADDYLNIYLTWYKFVDLTSHETIRNNRRALVLIADRCDRLTINRSCNAESRRYHETDGTCLMLRKYHGLPPCMRRHPVSYQVVSPSMLFLSLSLSLSLTHSLSYCLHHAEHIAYGYRTKMKPNRPRDNADNNNVTKPHLDFR